MKLRALNEILLSMTEEELRVTASCLTSAVARGPANGLRTLELFVTHDCNLACDYCFVGPKARARVMSWEVARAGVDLLIRESAGERELGLTFFGGEPLLARDLVERTAAYAAEQAAKHEKALRFALTTNGLLIGERALNFARSHGLLYLVSVDGSKEMHDRHRRRAGGQGTFTAVLAKLRLLKEAQHWVGVRITITPDTVRGLARAVEELHHQGVNQFLVGCADTYTWTEDDLAMLRAQVDGVKQFYEDARAAGLPIRINALEDDAADRNDLENVWGCGAGMSRLALTADGDLYPCCRFVGSDEPDEGYWLGDLERGIVRWDRIRDLSDGRRIVRYPCLTCDLSDRCSGGCPALNLRDTGSIYMPGASRCAVHRIWVTAALNQGKAGKDACA